jgi:DtxR family Mn-dependent transcriptional regulator
METTPAIQDYLGAIYDLTGGDKPVIGARLARHMHVSAPSITEALRRMQREGYVRLAGKKEIRLTTKGKGMAETMARRHRLLERWLTDVLGLDWSRAHEEAHRLEHALSPVVEERLAEQLGMPSTCPHGNPIPGMPAPEAHNPIPLSQAHVGQELTVERITEEAEADRQLLHFLWESGIRPGGAPRHQGRGALRGHHHGASRWARRHHGAGGIGQDLGLRPQGPGDRPPREARGASAAQKTRTAAR